MLSQRNKIILSSLKFTGVAHMPENTRFIEIILKLVKEVYANNFDDKSVILSSRIGHTCQVSLSRRETPSF